ncbi:HAD-IC family P-type ATPase [Ectothiorhodospiraceae bacterium WFHF3C12]|nr:HAD-IC family P-type ATPase [Ectothiorhodospiraceae bacterium WFHF3C12]
MATTTSAMEEPLYFTITHAESWAMETTVRNRLLALAGVREVRVRLGDGRVTVLGEGLDSARVIAAARQAGCELTRDPPGDPVQVGAAWPSLNRQAGGGPLGGAGLACLAGLILAVAESFNVLPAMSGAGAEAFWLAVSGAVLLIGAALVRACLAGAGSYPGTAVLSAAAVLCCGALLNWAQTLVGCLYLSAGCGPSYGYLDSALVGVGAAGLIVAMGRNSWARVNTPLLEQMPQPPKTVRVLRDGLAQSLDLDRLRVGEMVHAVMGDAIAADGILTRGYGTVDEVAITGRGEGQTKREGDEVLAGSRVRDGDFVYCVNRTGSRTVLAALVNAAAARMSGRARAASMARLIGLCAALAACSAVVWQALRAAEAGATLQVAITVFMVAAPMGFLWGRARVLSGVTSRLVQAGVVARSHEALSRAARLRAVFFDQGLSLTVGEPQVMGVEPATGVRVRDLFTLAASVEADSRHPLAEAVISAALERDLPILPTTDFESWPQEGVAAVIDGRRVLVGNTRLMHRFAVPPSLEQRCEEMADDGRAVIHVAVDGRHIGLLAVEDAPATGAAETIAGLAARDIEPVMLTGASRRSAVGFARSLGIENVRAELSPQRKAEIATTDNGGAAATVVRAGVVDPPPGADLSIVVRGPGEGVPGDGDVVLFSGLTGLLRLIDEAREARAVMGRMRWMCLLYLLVVVPMAAGASVVLFDWLIPSILAPIAAAVAVIVLDSMAANSVASRWSMEGE